MHRRLAVGDETRQHQRGGRADVAAVHDGPREPVDPSDESVVPLGGDARAQTHEVVHVAESSHEEGLGDDRDPIRHREHRGDEGLIVRRDPGVGQGRHVDRAQARRALHRDPVSRDVEHPAHRFDLAQQVDHVVGTGVHHSHVAPGDERGGEIGGAHHAVGDDGVGGGGEFTDPVDGEARGAETLDARTHGLELSPEVLDFGFTRRVLDDGSPLGEHGGHHEVVGRRVAGVLESHVSGPQATRGRGTDHRAVVVKGRPHLREAVGVEVDRTMPEVIPSGQRH